LKYNKIGKEGLRNLASAVSNHGGILSLDVRNNPCYLMKECDKYRVAM
jgi:hypothetical protein